MSDKKSCKWCNVLMIGWQLTFAGSAVGGIEYYLNEVKAVVAEVKEIEQRVSDTITTSEKLVKDQVDSIRSLADKTVKDANNVVGKVTEISDKAQKTSENVEKSLKNLSDTADKLTKLSEEVQKVCKIKGKFL